MIHTTPTQEYRRTSHQMPGRLFKGLDAKVHSLIGYYRRRSRVLEDLTARAAQIETQAAELGKLSDHKLHERILEFRSRFRRRGRDQEELITDALAVIREVADRQVGLRPFPVQLVGALALHQGFLAEMATGEGKTHTAGLAAVLVGWTKQPCHIVTVNDYLAQRDAEWLKALYHFCGVSVGCVTSTMDPTARRQGYASDVTYTTSKEILADFLRDRLQLGGLYDPARRLIRRMLAPQSAAQDGLVLRGLHTAIIDEADSILIDEAVTPLIISAPHKNEVLREASLIANEIVSALAPETDYRVDWKYREVDLTDSGRQKMQEKCASRSGLWRGTDRRMDMIRQALTAREFFHRGKQYVVTEDKVVIVDEFTGRPMPQRSWRQGLHQAIEAKEGVPISDPTETVARLSFQRFFRLYFQLSGMTGTAHEAAGEFWQIYRLPVITIPTNKPCIRQQWPDRVFAKENDKWRAIVDEIQRLHATRQPVLVGTRNVAASEKLGSMLSERGMVFRLLNAVRHQEEAQIVADAGQPLRITIATNMAGRGTDIRLGKGVTELGGLHVIATERHESGRVDRQLFGRSARQGDPGSAQAFVSAEDELLRRYLPKNLSEYMRNYLQGNWPRKQKVAETAFGYAQHRAQRLAFRQRCAVLKMDDWIDEALAFSGPTVV